MAVNSCILYILFLYIQNYEFYKYLIFENLNSKFMVSKMSKIIQQICRAFNFAPFEIFHLRFAMEPYILSILEQLPFLEDKWYESDISKSK